MSELIAPNALGVVVSDAASLYLHADERGVAYLPGEHCAPLLDSQLKPTVDKDGWRWLPLTKESCFQLEALWGVTRASDSYRAYRDQLMGLTPEFITWWKACCESTKLNPEDFSNYQQLATAQTFTNGLLYNASEAGTGKTRTSLATIAFSGARKVLVVAPGSVVGEWQREAVKLGLNYRVEPITTDTVGSIEKRGDALRSLARLGGNVIAVTNYESFIARKSGVGKSLRVRPSLLGAATEFSPNILILDESWKVKSAEASTTDELMLLSSTVRHKILQSGTPIGNSVQDLWSQLRILGYMPWDYDEFCLHFVTYVTESSNGVKRSKPIGSKNIPFLLNYLAPIWFRVVKEGVLNLPPKLPPVTVELEMPRDLRDLYQRVLREGLAALGDELDLSDQRTIDLRLTQLSAGIKPCLDTGGYQAMPCAKLSWLEQFARDHLEGNTSRRLAVWCTFNTEVERITRSLRRILGDNKVAAVAARGHKFDRLGPALADPTLGLDLEELKDAYNSRGSDCQVLVMQIAKMNAGHNLQATDDDVSFTHTWSFIQKSQASDRSHRIGRVNSVNYWNLVYRNSMDQRILAATNRKENFHSQLSMESYRELVGVL